MPNGPVHVYWAEKATGLGCPRVHRAIDSYSQIMGSKHRVHFHTPIEAITVADLVEGPQCRGAALNHLAIDQIYADPEAKILFELVRLTDTAPVSTPPSILGYRQQPRKRR